MKRLKQILSTLLLGIAVGGTALAEFVHPGALLKQSDLERMRYMVSVGVEPWKSAFEQLQSDSRAQKDYVVRGDPSWTVVDRSSTHRVEFESDVTAAWLNTLMWVITQDEDHAQKAVDIFNAWKNLTEVTGGGTESLNAGLYAWKLVEAAEIIHHTYDGWSEADVDDFKAMLVYPGYSDTKVPDTVNKNNGTFYWRIYNGDKGRHGNQDMIAWRAMISMGVFLDNQKMYDRALRYFKGLAHRSDDLPYESGPGVSESQLSDNQYFTTYKAKRLSNEADYGYNGVLKHYIWENGQLQESSRDQQHALFGLGIAAGIAEVAWNQGDTVWNSLDNRLLKGFEFTAKYNLSYIQSFDDQTRPWEPDNFIQRTDRSGRWKSKSMNPHFESDFEKVSRGDIKNRPIFEQAAAHFDIRMGQGDEAVWTIRSRDTAINKFGYEKTGKSLDHPGWGALIFRRPTLTAGDPISGFANNRPVFKIPVVPAVIEAENFDYFPGDGESRTYHDTTSGNASEKYRNTDVDIVSSTEGGFAINQLAEGEWLTYTLHIPSSDNYSVYIRYRTSASGAGVHFEAGGHAVGNTMSLDNTNSLWRTAVIAEEVALDAGVQALRLFIDSPADGFEINSIRLTKKPHTAPEGYTLCSFERETCYFTGIQTIAYGAQGQFDFAEGTNSVACNNSQFSDPIAGQTKACFMRKATTQRITLQESATGFCSVDGSVKREHTGYTGDGFSDTINARGNGVEWQINGLAGEYTFRWRYANGSSTNRTAILSINNSNRSTEDFISTGGWDKWQTTSVNLTTQGGTLRLRLEANQNEGLGNIDYIEVTGPNVTARSCD